MNEENNGAQAENNDALLELESMFGESDNSTEDAEKTVLTQNLQDFAGCFPDWDLHPPVDR